MEGVVIIAKIGASVPDHFMYKLYYKHIFDKK